MLLMGSICVPITVLAGWVIISCENAEKTDIEKGECQKEYSYWAAQFFYIIFGNTIGALTRIISLTQVFEWESMKWILMW